MNKDHTDTHDTRPPHDAHHTGVDRDRMQVTPDRMPAGGWISDIALNENWRTTTIVQRHRDRAATNPTC